MNTSHEGAPKIPTLEDKVDSAIESILASYPETNSLPESFSQELVILKEKIKNLKEGNHQIDGAKEISYNEHTNSVFYKDKDGNKIKTTIGELVSGMEWGNEFNVDQKAFQAKKISREMYERYVLAFVKRETLMLLDKYIFDKEIERYEQKQNRSLKEAYEGAKEDANANPHEINQAGVLAEKMVQSLLMRLSADNPNIGFEVLAVNAYEDVELKIDFIIKVKNSNKGVQVGVEENDTIKKIQFTIATRTQETERKESQMRKFNDVIIIKMPQIEVTSKYNEWKKDKNSLGGPDKLFDKATEQAIVTEILK